MNRRSLTSQSHSRSFLWVGVEDLINSRGGRCKVLQVTAHQARHNWKFVAAICRLFIKRYKHYPLTSSFWHEKSKIHFEFCKTFLCWGIVGFFLGTTCSNDSKTFSFSSSSRHVGSVILSLHTCAANASSYKRLMTLLKCITSGSRSSASILVLSSRLSISSSSVSC